MAPVMTPALKALAAQLAAAQQREAARVANYEREAAKPATERKWS